MITAAARRSRAATSTLTAVSQYALNATSTTASAISSTQNTLTAATTRSLSSVADKPKVAQQKAKKKDKKGKKDADSDGGRKDRITDILIKAYDAESVPIPRGSDEEMARRAEIGRQYTIGMFKRHNELNHDMACKIKMKNHAIKMLPRDTMWKEEALKIDDSKESLPPKWRRIPMESPPIPGFDISEFIVKEDE